jgi:peroxiredoxin Q/BCP
MLPPMLIGPRLPLGYYAGQVTSPERTYVAPSVGKPAPRFSLPSAEGLVSLDDHVGQRSVLLVFYERNFRDFLDGDPTPGHDVGNSVLTLLSLAVECPRLVEAGAQVMAVSRDSLRQHAALKALHPLPFPLLSDENGEAGMLYGLLPQNRWAGSNHMYDTRCAVFVIGRNGTLRQRFTPDYLICDESEMPPEARALLARILAEGHRMPTLMRTRRLLLPVRAG